MAKALFGHVVSVDARAQALGDEVRRLRARVAELEVQLDQACRANEELHRSMSPLSSPLSSLDDALLHLDEPAYT